MAKPALFFTLVRNWYVGGFKIMRVTTEKRKQLYGSYIDEDMATHVNPGQTVGRFATVDAAQSKIDGVKAIRALHEPRIKDLSKRYSDAEQAQREAIEAFVKAPPETVIRVWPLPRLPATTDGVPIDESGQSPGFGP